MNFFLSYSHVDYQASVALRNRLNYYIQKGIINFWADQELRGGDKVNLIIQEQMHNADVFILLVSEHFMASNYIITIELKEAAQKFKEKHCRVIPIVLEDVSLQFLEEEFGEILNPLPQIAKVLRPINKWKKNETDTAWKIISEELLKIINSKKIGSSLQTINQTETIGAKATEGGDSRSYTATPQMQTPQDNVFSSSVATQNSPGILPKTENKEQIDTNFSKENEDILKEYLQHPELLLSLIKKMKQSNGN